MTDQVADDIAGLSYEAALAQLDALIQKLEGGSVPLEDAIAAYERGTRLARHCEELLDRTERRVTALMVGGDGRTTEKPLDIETSGSADAAPQPPAQPRARAASVPASEGGGLFAPARSRAGTPPVDPDEVPF
ncbi:MAG: exodeoxyribonuclease VII small subunit [Candidatus Dormibacteria bacterium]